MKKKTLLSLAALGAFAGMSAPFRALPGIMFGPKGKGGGAMTDADRARIMAAEAKRARRAAKRAGR